MLAHALDDAVLDLADYVAEWKWDGIRVQVVHAGGETRLYSRTGDDVTGSFPEVAGALMFDITVVSVGPYALYRREPPWRVAGPAQRVTRSGGHASPPTTTSVNSSSPPGSTVARAAVVTKAW